MGRRALFGRLCAHAQRTITSADRMRREATSWAPHARRLVDAAKALQAGGAAGRGALGARADGGERAAGRRRGVGRGDETGGRRGVYSTTGVVGRWDEAALET